MEANPEGGARAVPAGPGNCLPYTLYMGRKAMPPVCAAPGQPYCTGD